MKKPTNSERIKKIWDDAYEECSKVRAITCASCSGEATAFPYKQGKNGEFLSIDSPEPGVLLACVICPCCSFVGCTHCWYHGVMLDHHTLVNGTCTRCLRSYRPRPNVGATA